MEQSPDIRVSLEHVSKSFVKGKSAAPTKVVDDVSFDVRDGEFLVLLGPGRCGKSVLLNIIAGLIPADSGAVYLDGKPVLEPNPSMGMVFQKIGLLPWLNVMDNVTFGPKNRGEAKETYLPRAQKYIDMVGLTGFERHYPYQLSGGMKQRAGIARAYANEPKILIMDEPFGALDAQTRYSMQNELMSIWLREKRTILFVTNNLEEALLLGDRIILFTNCPARCKRVYEIDMPRPRDTMDRRFLDLRRAISENMDLAL